MEISLFMVLVSIFCVSGEEVARRSSATARYREEIPLPGEYDARAQDGVLVDERVVMGYSDSWVVEVEGDRDQADRLADEYGFVNLGQVSVHADHNYLQQNFEIEKCLLCSNNTGNPVVCNTS